MSIIDKILDFSILFSFDRSGFLRHAKKFKPEKFEKKKKTALITGGNSGIGYATAKTLLRYGHDVHIICRDKKKGQEALESLNSTTENNAVTLHILDMSDRNAVQKWVETNAPFHLDILINNAGGMPAELTFNKLGDEITWATHFLGHFDLTNALLKREILTDQSRVVFVTSGGMYLQKLDLEDITWKKNTYNKYKAYANAKRAQVILTELLDEAWGPKIKFSSVHPGWVETKGVKFAMPAFYKWLKKRLRTPEQGADTIVWLSLTEEDYPGGKLWFDRSIAATHKFSWTKESQDDRKALWKILNAPPTA